MNHPHKSLHRKKSQMRVWQETLLFRKQNMELILKMRFSQEVLAHRQGVHDELWNVKTTLLLACTTTIKRSKKGSGDGLPPAKLLPLLHREVGEESEIVLQGERLTRHVGFPCHQALIPRKASLLYFIAWISMHQSTASRKGITLIMLG